MPMTCCSRPNSRYRTYWQVAVLNVLRNGVWVPDSGTEAAAHGSARVPRPRRSQPGAVSSGTRDFKAAVADRDLCQSHSPGPAGNGRHLGNPRHADRRRSGLAHRRRRRDSSTPPCPQPPVTDPESLGGNASVAADPPALVQADTALPALPPSIEALARSITDGAQGPLAQAELLTNWFRSGQFHYTLDPPASPPGTDPLVSFLTQTRSGSCEQFAGAYVVLARSLGLPSRVVVGFTAGRYSGPGEVSVQGADAHAWPQVYLGHSAGWVSFEPTPQQPRGEVAPEGVVGPSGVTQHGAGGSTDDRTIRDGAVLRADDGAYPGGVERLPHRRRTAAPVSSSGLGIVGWALVGAAVVLAVVARAPPPPPSPPLVTGGSLTGPTGAPRSGRGRASVAPRGGRAPAVAASRSSSSRICARTIRTPGDRAASLFADGITVATAADAALFDPLGTSAQRSQAAYEAALRVRQELQHAAAAPPGVTDRV